MDSRLTPFDYLLLNRSLFPPRQCISYTIKLQMLKQLQSIGSKLENIKNCKKKISQYSYFAQETIGKGYSSQVYRGSNDLTDEEVAIKLIDMRNVKGDVHRVLLANEIEILKMLKNLQNIIEVYDIFNLKTHTCIVTQLCSGGDLAKRIKTKKFLPEAQAIQILKQIISGYKNIHRFGIVHRDLKPANIFFVGDTIKIADFGFAIRETDLKKTNSYNVGSPVYMPLESLNDNQYSSKSDVWAIGVIFYEMLTGKTPWRAKTESDLKRQIKSTPIQGLIPGNISDVSVDFLIKALQPNLSLRMTPEEMERHFSYSQNPVPRNVILASLRTNAFRSRAVSHQHEERSQSNIGKNTMCGPKTFRKISMLGNLNPQQSKYEQLIRTTATLGLGTEAFMMDHRKTSNYLISQIHFCRFIYKLLGRLPELSIDPSGRLSELMGLLISGKLKQIVNLKGLPGKHAQVFRSTKQYEKIFNVVEQYKVKYAHILKLDLTELYEDACAEIKSLLDEEVLSLYRIVSCAPQIEVLRDEVVMLDYLVTFKQLLSLMSRSDLESFHVKSKIQAIVEGKPAKTVTKEHMEAITGKMRAINLL